VRTIHAQHLCIEPVYDTAHMSIQHNLIAGEAHWIEALGSLTRIMVWCSANCAVSAVRGILVLAELLKVRTV